MIDCAVQDELALNEHLASAKALSQYLLEQLKKQNAQPAGSVPLTALVTALRSFSSDCLGLSTITLACIAGHACVSVSDSVKYEAWAPAAAAMMYSMLDPSTAATRQAAVHEFKRKDEAAKSRSAAVQAIQVRARKCMLHDEHDSGALAASTACCHASTTGLLSKDTAKYPKPDSNCFSNVLFEQ